MLRFRPGIITGTLAAALLTSPMMSWASDTTPPYDSHISETYSGTDNWLCHPNLDQKNDACARNQSTLVVQADGSSSVETSQPAPMPEVDCFYVYPTTSLDLGPNSDLNPNRQEEETTWQQAGRYSEVCRVFAPVYRQRTLSYLAVNMVAGSLVPEETLEEAQRIAYADVLDAFREYMAYHNGGRGFILVGHSQGSRLISQLIAEEIEPDAGMSDQMIAAHIPGYSVAVPRGQDVGAEFQHTPACREASQTGCVISYASFRQGDEQLAEPRFGITEESATAAMCVNPAALTGGRAELNAYLPFKYPPAYETLMLSRGTGGPYASRWTNLFISKRQTPFYKVPGQIRGECVEDDNGTRYLEVSILADPNDPRADDYPGEFFAGRGWGLHLADINLVQGDLVQLARSQSDAWLKLH